MQFPLTDGVRRSLNTLARIATELATRRDLDTGPGGTDAAGVCKELDVMAETLQYYGETLPVVASARHGKTPSAPAAPVVEVRKPRKNANGEWCVAVYVNGKRCEDRCYYTDDRADAMATYGCMVGVPAAGTIEGEA